MYSNLRKLGVGSIFTTEVFQPINHFQGHTHIKHNLIEDTD